MPRSLGRELYDRNPQDPPYLRRLTEHAWDNRRSFEGLFASPSHPGVQARVQAVWLELATNYDLQGIHFDYVRLPSPDFDYSRGALDRFRAWVRPHLSSQLYADLVGASRADPYALADALGDLWDQFRREQVSTLVRRIYRSVKEVRPDLVISAALVPDPKEARVKRYQEWSNWLADGILDVAVPMAYTTDREQFDAWVEEARVSAGASQRVWIGVGAFKNPVDETLRQIGSARDYGVGGVVVFAYGAAASTAAQPGTPTPLQRIGRRGIPIGVGAVRRGWSKATAPWRRSLWGASSVRSPVSSSGATILRSRGSSDSANARGVLMPPSMALRYFTHRF